jgi:hypothetical protein
MWLAFFPRQLQMISELPNNARSYGIGAPHDVALTRTSGVEGQKFVTLLSHIAKMRNRPHRMGGL